ncbi:hypothetical protein LCGC14_2938770, partial [marine sediment metagenome]
AIRDSFNVSSITDNNVGDYTINFINALSSIDYSVGGIAGNLAGALTDLSKKEPFDIYNEEHEHYEKSDLDKGKLQQLKRCFVTVEDCIERELRHNNIAYQRISNPCNTLDVNLEILRVPSTSNDVDKEYRKEIISVINQLDNSIVTICNGEPTSSLNMVSNKGSNKFINCDTVVIATKPDPQRIIKYMRSTGLKEQAAVDLIMTDDINQAVGRNMGYRNLGTNKLPGTGKNKCLLIIPEDSDLTLDLHNVTSKIVNLTHWHSTRRDDRIEMCLKNQFLHKELINKLGSVYGKNHEESDQYKVLDALENHISNNPESSKIKLTDLNVNGINSKTIKKILENEDYTVRKFGKSCSNHVFLH